MNKQIKKILFWLSLLGILVLLFLALDQRFNILVKEDNLVIMDFVEVNDYQGENFSAFDDFRENSIKGSQYVDRENYRLKIFGLANESKELIYSEVVDNYNAYKKLATLNCVEGWSVKILWEGVLVSDLLKDLGVKLEANTVIFKAYDGYSTSFPLEYVMDNKIIMAYKMNDQEIPAERGFPFQLVAESKWGYKWIKWITEIEISDEENYEGFWESRGYSDSGDLDKPKRKN